MRHMLPMISSQAQAGKTAVEPASTPIRRDTPGAPTSRLGAEPDAAPLCVVEMAACSITCPFSALT